MLKQPQPTAPIGIPTNTKEHSASEQRVSSIGSFSPAKSPLPAGFFPFFVPAPGSNAIQSDGSDNYAMSFWVPVQTGLSTPAQAETTASVPPISPVSPR